jgi:NAD(P)H-quinone oxidoreductase subunit 5
MKVAFFDSCSGVLQPGRRGAARPLDGTELRAVPALLAAASAGAVAWATLHPQPTAVAGLSIDRVTATVALLVSGIGTVTFGYAARCLEGHPRRTGFLRALAVTVTAAWLLSLADSFVLLVTAWLATGLGVDRMLRFSRERPRTHVIARRKFIVSRFGDALLVAAAAVAWTSWGTSGISATVAAASATEPGPALTSFVLLLCAAALLKCAQAPFHGWLPETVEAPTPFSAMMHAGIVNAGGALLVRFAPAVARVPEAWIMLSAVGTASILLAAPAAWVQARAKAALAWSTVSQMGFMMVQCGLCAFPAALLHLVGHGTYKAWSFMRAGEVPPHVRPTSPTFRRAVTLLGLGTVASVPALHASAGALGILHGVAPGELALMSIVAIACGQAWVAWLGTPRRSAAAAALRLGCALACSALLPATACLAYAAADAWVEPSMPARPTIDGACAWVAAAMPVAAVLVLAVAHAWACSPRHRARPAPLLVHALSGFYVGITVGRALDRVHSVLRRAFTGVARA